MALRLVFGALEPSIPNDFAGKTADDVSFRGWQGPLSEAGVRSVIDRPGAAAHASWPLATRP